MMRDLEASLSGDTVCLCTLVLAERLCVSEMWYNKRAPFFGNAIMA